MKILKNNYKEALPEYPKVILCPNCNSELEIIEADLKSVPVPYANDNLKTFAGSGFVCPCCNGLIILG